MWNRQRPQFIKQVKTFYLLTCIQLSNAVNIVESEFHSISFGVYVEDC